MLQGMKRPMFAIWMGISRQVAAPWALFTLFTTGLGYGTIALWFSIAIIVWSAAGISFWFAQKTLRRVEDKTTA